MRLHNIYHKPKVVNINTLIAVFFYFGSFLANPVFAQNVDRIDPPNWWVGMQNDTLELMVVGSDLSDNVSVQGKKIKLLSTEVNPNKHYLFLELFLNENTPHQEIKLKIDGKNFSYVLAKRNADNKTLMGLDPSDLIYLITPDRFANGNPSNDSIKGMNEMEVDRNKPYGRHGGDIEGIQNKLDYIEDLGVTALWLNPVLENDQPEASYHGYAITDHYTIDPRFGTNTEYRYFVDSCHKKGIKVIMDVIYNHFGNEHYLLKDLPEPSMLNEWADFTQTNYRATSLHDPYASEYDKKRMSDGWFDHHMPDVNQRNKHMSRYLIQNSIWWVESFGIDAFRIDTYAYPDQGFMAALAKAIAAEYPSFFMFGETWVHGIQVQAWYTGNNPNRKYFDSGLQSVTDFQLAFAIHKGLNEKHGWAEGINRVYYSLSGDYLYNDPARLVTFIDNHDIARTYGLFNKDFRKYKMANTILLTSRGIPQLYYGTEILMAATDGHGEIREDFWGGWPEDTINKFTTEGRTSLENEAFDFIRTLANYRKSSKALTQGKLIQFVPEKGVYCYFRFTEEEEEEEEVMVIMNASDDNQEVNLERFKERLNSRKSFLNVLTSEKSAIPLSLTLLPYETLILQLE